MEKERYEEIFRDQALSEGGLRSGGYAIGGAKPTKGKRYCYAFDNCTPKGKFRCQPGHYEKGAKPKGFIPAYELCKKDEKIRGKPKRRLLTVEKEANKIKRKEKLIEKKLLEKGITPQKLEEAEKIMKKVDKIVEASGSGHKKGYKCIKEGYGPSGKKRCEIYQPPSGGYRHKKGYKGDRYCVEEEYGPSGKKRCKKYEPGLGGVRRVKRGGSEANFEAAERSPWISFLLQVANDTGLTYADVLKDARKGSPRRQEILDAYAEYKRNI
jgi:hypothetical protein